MEFSAIIPVYNEEEAIEHVFKLLKDVLDKNFKTYEIIGVDDGSTDKSRKLMEDLGFVKVIPHKKNMGYGAALKTGIKNSKGDYICILDADATYPPNEIPGMLKALKKEKGTEICLGSRFMKESSMTPLRKIGNIMFTYVVFALFGCKNSDVASGMRIFTKEIIKKSSTD